MATKAISIRIDEEMLHKLRQYPGVIKAEVLAG